MQKSQWIVKILGTLLALVDAETLRKAADALLDVIEDKIEESDNTWDNAVIQPLIDTVRAAFQIPDND